jgi:hypothetical protein
MDRRGQPVPDVNPSLLAADPQAVIPNDATTEPRADTVGGEQGDRKRAASPFLHWS